MSSSEDTTTETEESAMAKAASSGGRRMCVKGYSTPAATGIPSELYPSEKRKLICHAYHFTLIHISSH